jgi:hypothetical protein
MKTDLRAMRVELEDAIDVIREIKFQARAQRSRSRIYSYRKIAGGNYRYVPIERRQIVRRGKNLTPDEGRALAAAKREVTLYCTIRAAMRGRFHSMALLTSPEKLEALATAWRSYAVLEPPPAAAEAATEVSEQEPEEVSVVQVPAKAVGP